MTSVDLKKLAPLLGRGIVSNFSPDIIKGMLIELFRSKKVSVAEATKWVEGNISLWGSLKPEHQSQLIRMVQKVGDISWVNADWAIKSLKDDFPTLASLFLGWRKAHNWLERQLDEIKTQVRQ